MQQLKRIKGLHATVVAFIPKIWRKQLEKKPRQSFGGINATAVARVSPIK
jgi:hypothetical protein